MAKLFLVAGARPNFMKIAPILRALEPYPYLEGIVVHTGQHYDSNMSGSFFKSLGIGTPKYNLEVGSGTHAVQTANIMVKFEEVCLDEKPDLVVVVGDVNSTIAAGLVAKKLHIRLCHVEAGLRSHDWTMPEEINRIATDAITDIFFTTEKEGTSNLLAEGHDSSNVHFVGHVMIDNLHYQLSKIGSHPPSPYSDSIKKALPAHYMCLTLHRPSNVDNKETLGRLLGAIKRLSEKAPVLFPCHPRTRKNIERFGFSSLFSEISFNGPIQKTGLFITEPLGYNDFLYLWKDACLMLTDSGGLQEETTGLKIPCITLRENTERPITAEIGSNVIVGSDVDKIIKFGEQAIEGEWKKSLIPELWDGKASERIATILDIQSIGLKQSH
jgi:UDP-N-acetylglucosamine 2-epimerase (non-hydrolysing)